MNYLLVVDDSFVERQLAKGLLGHQFHHQIEFASTGWEALEHIESRLPLVVITDLQMPEMDGLQLTETIRRRFPSVPVILMTAYGSEAIAVDALKRGAMDYVPKSKRAYELCRAVEAVLSMRAITTREGEQCLHHCLRFEQTHYELDNDRTLIPPLVDHLQHVARELRLVDDVDQLRLAKALTEAISNAIYHGNLELPTAEVSNSRLSPGDSEFIRRRRQQAPFRDRHVTVEATVSAEIGRFVVRDQGPGFDIRTVPSVTDNPSRLASDEHRGLVLIKLFMDETHFSDQGNEITLVKYRQSSLAKAS